MFCYNLILKANERIGKFYQSKAKDDTECSTRAKYRLQVLNHSWWALRQTQRHKALSLERYINVTLQCSSVYSSKNKQYTKF